MLETIRQFAEDQLAARGVAETVRTVQSRYFADKETEILAVWDSPDQREAYTWFKAELANLRPGHPPRQTRHHLPRRRRPPRHHHLDSPFIRHALVEGATVSMSPLIANAGAHGG